jgi:hypothetical protein
MSAIPKSWKPSRRDGSSSLYCLIGDFVSQEIAFVRLVKVFVAIVHRGGCPIPRQSKAAGSGDLNSYAASAEPDLKTD